MPRTIICPACGQDDQVEKVSALYVAGISVNRMPANADPLHVKLDSLSKHELRDLAGRLTPPASPKRAPARPIQPDLMVAVFSIIIPFFLVGVFQSQRPLLLPLLAALAVLYAFYFWKRKAIIVRFERQVSSGQEAEMRIRRGIERWMMLYYCLREDVVFMPGKKEPVPADQLHWYLMKD